jgi:hypothetical protein
MRRKFAERCTQNSCRGGANAGVKSKLEVEIHRFLQAAVSVVVMRVMHIRQVRVSMPHWFVLVRMGVWFAGPIRGLMGMSVVDVVNMRMRVNESLVNVLVLVTFGQVQPYADGHQGACD